MVIAIVQMGRMRKTARLALLICLPVTALMTSVQRSAASLKRRSVMVIEIVKTAPMSAIVLLVDNLTSTGASLLVNNVSPDPGYVMEKNIAVTVPMRMAVLVLITGTSVRGLQLQAGGAMTQKYDASDGIRYVMVGEIADMETMKRTTLAVS